MKVDMSPKAVKTRLKTMNELWLLSVKLMNSKKIRSSVKIINDVSDNARDKSVETVKN